MKIKLALGLLFSILLSVSLYLTQSDAKVSNFSFTSIDGKTHQLENYQGKVLLINFWATSCSSCMKEMPEFKRLQEKYGKQGYVTLAFAMYYDQEKYIQTYQTKSNLPFVIVHDKENQAAKQFGEIKLTPTTFLVSKNGEILQKFVGIPDTKQLESMIQKALSTS